MKTAPEMYRAWLRGGVRHSVLAAATIVGVSGSAYSAVPLRVMPLGDSITSGTIVPGEAGGSGGYRYDLWSQLNQYGGAYAGVEFVGTRIEPDAAPDPRALNHEGLDGRTIRYYDAPHNPGYLVDYDLHDATNTHPINAMLSAAQPDVILLQIGINDLFLGDDPVDSAGDLAYLIERIYAHSATQNAKIYVASILGRPVENYAWAAENDEDLANVHAFNAELPGIVEAFQNLGKDVTFVDMYSVLDYSGTTLDFNFGEGPNGDAYGLHPSAIGYGKMADAWFSAMVPEPMSASVIFAGALLLRRRSR